VQSSDPDEFNEPGPDAPPLMDAADDVPSIEEADDIPAIDEPGGDSVDERLERKRADEQARIELIRQEQQQQDDEAGRQRRQNVRVDVQLPVTLRMGGREAPARTRDVSATGIGFSTRLPVEFDMRGECTIEFDGWHFRKAFVIRFIKPILAGHQVGVQFEELTQEEREKLVKQVFDLQRAQLQTKRR
jgi:c-di-GMP-binding flagellar brake protein YcgR